MLPLLLISALDPCIWKPLVHIVTLLPVALSAVETAFELGNSLKLQGLEGFLTLSNRFQLPAKLLPFTKTNLGLNPQLQNSPSTLALPL